MRVVCGIDGSDHSMVALRRAERIAAWLDGELHVVFCAHLSPMLFASGEISPARIDEIERHDRDAVWELADEVLAEMDGKIPVKKIDLKGYPADALVKYAEEVDADLLVVGSRGRGAFSAWLLGSTSIRVLHTAKCDVLIVRGAE